MALYKITGGDGRVYGPANEEELRRWLAEGRLNGQSLIQPEGSTEWRPLSTFPEFAEALGQRTAPPPPLSPLSPAPGVPVNPELLAVEILASRLTVRIGACLSRSWHLLLANFGLIFGATAVVWLIETVCERLPLINWGYLLIKGPLYGGLYLIFLRRLRNQPAAFGDVFAGFRLAFGQLLLAGLVTSLLQSLGLLCLCVLPGIYLWVAWRFSIPLVVDKNLEFWGAMELSRKVVNRVWFSVLGLVLLAFLPTILVNLAVDAKIGVSTFSSVQQVLQGGAPDPQRLGQNLVQIFFQAAKANLPLLALTKIVLLLNLPWALGALMYAYEDLFGARPARTA